jgi:hypothetical protein
METHEIGIWFLLLTLFVPRSVLFFWWVTGNLPFNTTPFFADVLCAIFLPRVLVLVYIYQNMGMGPWFYIHLIALIIAWGYNLLNFESNMEKLKKASV